MWSLQNWVDGTGYLARDETAYFGHHEVISLVPVRDNGALKLEIWVEDKLIQWWPRVSEIG